MASRFITPFFDAGSGITPSDGALLEFFITGTSTPKDTFSDEALTTPNANPVIADSNGLFPDIWLPEGARYKVTLDDKNIVQKWEADPVIAASGGARNTISHANVAAMVADTALLSGMLTDTADYAAFNVGGGAHYLVMTSGEFGGTPDGFIDHTLSNGNVAKLQHNGVISPTVAGAVSGAADVSSELLAINGNATIEKILIDQSETFNITTDVDFTRSIAIEGTGTINADATSAFTIGGTLTDLGNITAAVAKGDRVITVSSVTGIIADSLICLQNQVASSFSPHRTNYFDGEFAVVRSVSGLNVTLSAPTETSYAGVSTDKIFLVNSVTPAVRGTKFTGGDSYPLKLTFCRDGIVENIDCNGGAFGSFAIDKCYNLNGVGGAFYHDEAAIGLNYGIVILNSQNITLSGFDAYGTRHGTSTGGDAQDGAVPNRKIIFRDARISSDGSLYAADFHGNTADSGYYDCTSTNNVGLAGRNVEWVGGKVTGGTSNAPLAYHELVGGYMRFDRVKVGFSTANTANRVVGNLGSTLTANISEQYVVEATRIEVDSTSDIVNFLVAFDNATLAVKNSWMVDDIRVTGDVSVFATMIANVISGSGLRPERVTVDNIDMDISSLTNWMTISGGSFAGAIVTMPKVSFRDTLTIPTSGTESTTGGTSGALVCVYPTYPVVPDILHTQSGHTVNSAGPGYAMTALVAAATTTTASVKMVSGDAQTAFTVAKSAITSAKVGMDSVTLI